MSRPLDRYLLPVFARAFHLLSDTHMHSLPFCNRIACVLCGALALRSTALGTPLAMAAPARMSAPSLSHRPGASQPPRLGSLPNL
eukprot:1261075-Pleurochrysis_carterae.AAC.1